MCKETFKVFRSFLREVEGIRDEGAWFQILDQLDSIGKMFCLLYILPGSFSLSDSSPRKDSFFPFFFFFILIDDSLNEGIVIEGWKSGAREKCVFGLQRCIVRSRRVVNFSKLCYVSEFIYDILYGLSKLSRG